MNLIAYAGLTILIFLFYPVFGLVFGRDSSGTALLLSVGIGLGIGLFGGPEWGWPAIGLAATLSFASILFKSSVFRDYITQCQKRGTSPSLFWYFLLSSLRNSVVMFIVAFVVFFLTRHTPR